MKDILRPLRVVHGKLHDWFTDTLPLRLEFFHLFLERICHPRVVYLILTPEHGNLGDHAIALSEIQILNELGIPYIEVTGKKIGEWSKKHFLHVMNGKPIIINGGGNLGTIWPSVEATIRAVIKNNPRSKILICPSTFFYENDEKGAEELEKSKQIYNSHNNLIIYARENESYVKMKEVYRNVSLAPDMVLRLNECRNGPERHGAILCLRTDRERTYSIEDENSINAQMRILFDKDIAFVDMLKTYEIPLIQREEELEKQYNAFQHAKLVVTDRLHGMIFCVITGTPCVVINSKSPKVKGCYEWVKDLPYIRFCEDVNQIALIYQEIPRQEWQYDNSKLLPYYDSLVKDILRLAGRKQ